ncbi:MAG: SPOR domain-containing protein [Pseudomonadota bacterium]
MKNLLLLLLLANILYFLYSAIRGDEERRGEILIEESQLGPQLQLAEVDPKDPASDTDSVDEAVTEPAADDSGADDAAVDASNDDATTADDEAEAAPAEPEDPPLNKAPPQNILQASVGRACATLGQFDKREDADRAYRSLVQQGYDVKLRSELGQIPSVYWVHIRDIPSDGAADAMLEDLARGGFGEAYTISTDDDGLKITIGFFGKRDGAERVELQVASLGLKPTVEPRLSDGTVYFIDVGMPVGKGAQAFIGQYGEDRVALRDRATCPD